MKPVALTIVALLSVLLAFPAFAEDLPESDQKVIGLLQQAEDFCEVDRTGEAEPLLVQAEKLKPDSAELYRIWGCVYERKGQWKKAEDQYAKWATLNPKSYRPLEAMGRMAVRQKHFADANEYLSAARRINPYRTYIADNLCGNLVQMRKWQEAVAACGEAIALNPKDGYPYGERSRAEHALGQIDKANADAEAAGSVRRDMGRIKFLTDKMFPFIFGIISLAFLLSGLAVLFTKKPLLFSARWMFAVMVLCFIPQFIMPFVMPDIGSDRMQGFRLMNWLMPAMFLVLLGFLWIQMQGYIVFGVVDKSFRKALLSALDELHLSCEEQLSFIRVPSADLDIQVAMQAWTGIGQIKIKGDTGHDSFQQIVGILKGRFRQGEIETNNLTPTLYIVLGVFMLLFCIILMQGF